jgi:NADH-quinone oxidoreductase subunit N
MGKLMVFSAAVDAGLLGLAIIGVLGSVAGTYYLRVIVCMFMRPVPSDATKPFRHGRQRLLWWFLPLRWWARAAAWPVTSWLSRVGMVFGS